MPQDNFNDPSNNCKINIEPSPVFQEDFEIEDYSIEFNERIQAFPKHKPLVRVIGFINLDE